MPSPLTLTLISSPIYTCGSLVTKRCSSAKLSPYGMGSNQVCGRLTGYQVE